MQPDHTEMNGVGHGLGLLAGGKQMVCHTSRMMMFVSFIRCVSHHGTHAAIILIDLIPFFHDNNVPNVYNVTCAWVSKREYYRTYAAHHDDRLLLMRILSCLLFTGYAGFSADFLLFHMCLCSWIVRAAQVWVELMCTSIHQLNGCTFIHIARMHSYSKEQLILKTTGCPVSQRNNFLCYIWDS